MGIYFKILQEYRNNIISIIDFNSTKFKMVDTMTNFQSWNNRNINWIESKINKAKLAKIPILLWFIMILSLIIFQTECKETKTRNLVDECQEGYYFKNGMWNIWDSSWKSCSEGKNDID